MELELKLATGQCNQSMTANPHAEYTLAVVLVYVVAGVLISCILATLACYIVVLAGERKKRAAENREKLDFLNMKRTSRDEVPVAAVDPRRTSY